MEPFLGEIRLFSWQGAPTGWAICDGSLVKIMANPPLFALLGTTFGGDGTSTFALPDLRGRLALPAGTGTDKIAYSPGDVGGQEGVALSIATMPAHAHGAFAYDAAPANKAAINGNLPGKATLANGSGGTPIYGPLQATVPLNPGSVVAAGADTAHANMQPFLVLNFCMAVEGIFPPRQ